MSCAESASTTAGLRPPPTAGLCPPPTAGLRPPLARILVVDDQQENTSILEKLLQPKGYEVIVANSGKAAIEIIEKDPPDVILLDLLMPDVDGFEVCRRLRKSRGTRHIPVIIITGVGDRDANIRALELGVDDFLVKPFDSVLLEARMRNSLRSKMLQDEVIRYQRQLEEYNQTLGERIKERTAQLVRTQQVAVFTLAKLAESRDTETGAHLERMRLYAREIAEELAGRAEDKETIGPGFVEVLYQSSPLHDIGKVGIPDKILLKPGKLTPEEFEIMKLHSTIGGDTLRAADLEAGQDSFLAMGRDIAYYHHERWDGKGYPKGLWGTIIPLSARIVAVGDVYDALTSKRPYKEPFGHEKSRAIIREGCGTAFDPDVVDAFFAREERIIEIRARLQDPSGLTMIEKLNKDAEKLSGAPQADTATRAIRGRTCGISSLA